MKIEKIKYSARHEELLQKRNELGEKLTKVTAEQWALSREEIPAIEPVPDDADARRMAAIFGKEVPPAPPSVRERLIAMAREIRDLRSNIDFLDGQLAAERHKAESAYRASLAPIFHEKLRAVALAMKAVHSANVELQALIDAVESQGVSLGNILTFPPQFIGNPRDPNGTMARFFREAVEIGVLSKGETPRELAQ